MKKIFFWAILIIIIAALGVFVFSGRKLSQLGALDVLAKEGIILEVAKGQAKVNLAGAEKTLNAPASQEIEKDVIVETLAGGQANIIFPGGSLARLDEKTVVSLMDFTSNGGQEGVKFYLDSGTLWSRVQRLLDVETTYEVQTVKYSGSC